MAEPDEKQDESPTQKERLLKLLAFFLSPLMNIMSANKEISAEEEEEEQEQEDKQEEEEEKKKTNKKEATPEALNWLVQILLLLRAMAHDAVTKEKMIKPVEIEVREEIEDSDDNSVAETPPPASTDTDPATNNNQTESAPDSPTIDSFPKPAETPTQESGQPEPGTTPTQKEAEAAEQQSLLSTAAKHISSTTLFSGSNDMVNDADDTQHTETHTEADRSQFRSESVSSAESDSGSGSSKPESDESKHPVTSEPPEGFFAKFPSFMMKLKEMLGLSSGKKDEDNEEAGGHSQRPSGP